MNTFGIVIACCRTDAHYAKACLASIRHFLGDIPVFILVDGPASPLDSVAHLPGVRVMSNAQLRDARLKKLCRGWGHTKMAALWEAPFETFLYLDADTVVWGDILSVIPSEPYDFIVDRQKTYSDESIYFWFFNRKKLERHYPDFDWARYRDRYACGGTFFARRGALDLDEYQNTCDIQQQDDSVFLFGDMGMWNFLLFHGEQRGRLLVRSVTFQVIPVDHEENELRTRYSPQALAGGGPPEPAVLHFCGKKATIFSSSARVASMNYFRLQSLQQYDGLPVWRAIARMAAEDARCVFWPKVKRGWGKLKKIARGCFRGKQRSHAA